MKITKRNKAKNNNNLKQKYNKYLKYYPQKAQQTLK